jgi:hypothetical protein
MGERRGAYRVLVGKPEGRRQFNMSKGNRQPFGKLTLSTLSGINVDSDDGETDSQ